MESFTVGIDQGTSSTKVCLIDAGGVLRWEAEKSHALCYPQPGYVELDAELVLDNVRSLFEQLGQAVVDRQFCRREEVTTVALANQRETLVFWRRSTGRSLCPAIVWNDTRTEGICRELIARFGSADHFKQRNGLRISTYFSAFKLLWALQHCAEVGHAAGEDDLLVGTIDSWLMFHLLEGAPHLTDATNASRTFLLNLHTLAWDEHILAELGLNSALLPHVRDCCGLFGRLASGAFAGAELRAVVGDQQAAVFGLGALSVGHCTVTFGTGTFLMAPLGPCPLFSPDFLTTVLFRQGAETLYAFEGAVECGGTNIAYITEGLPLITSLTEANLQAAALPSTAMLREMYLLGTLNGVLAPHWNPAVGGLLFGLRLGDTPLDLYLATLEGIIFRLKENLDLLVQNSVECVQLRLNGGLSRAEYLVRFLAQLELKPILRGDSAQGTVMGTALLGLLHRRDGRVDLAALEGFDRSLQLYTPPQDEKLHAGLQRKFARFQRLMAINAQLTNEL